MNFNIAFYNKCLSGWNLVSMEGILNVYEERCLQTFWQCYILKFQNMVPNRGIHLCHLDTPVFFVHWLNEWIPICTYRSTYVPICLYIIPRFIYVFTVKYLNRFYFKWFILKTLWMLQNALYFIKLTLIKCAAICAFPANMWTRNVTRYKVGRATTSLRCICACVCRWHLAKVLRQNDVPYKKSASDVNMEWDL